MHLVLKKCTFVVLFQKDNSVVQLQNSFFFKKK